MCCVLHLSCLPHDLGLGFVLDCVCEQLWGCAVILRVSSQGCDCCFDLILGVGFVCLILVGGVL